MTVPTIEVSDLIEFLDDELIPELGGDYEIDVSCCST